MARDVVFPSLIVYRKHSTFNALASLKL